MLMPTIWGESLFDDFFDDFMDFRRPVRRPEPKRAGLPAAFMGGVPTMMKTDIRENENGFDLDIDLPGFKKEDVKAELKDGYLTISAERKADTDEKDEGGKYIRRERYYGTCSRSFYVGDLLTEEDIKARFEDGILKLSVPKKEPEPVVEQKHFISIEG